MPAERILQLNKLLSTHVEEICLIQFFPREVFCLLEALVVVVVRLFLIHLWLSSRLIGWRELPATSW